MNLINVLIHVLKHSFIIKESLFVILIVLIKVVMDLLIVLIIIITDFYGIWIIDNVFQNVINII